MIELDDLGDALAGVSLRRAVRRGHADW
jgi:hypothetical protein